MKKAGVKVLQGEKWQIERDLVLKEGKIYVSKNVELRMEIIWLHYDSETWRKVEDDRIGDKELLVA